MGWEKHVGRVGALAVALGIGSAVAAVPGVAWAQPDGASSAGASASPAGGSPGTTKVADTPSRPAGSKDAAGSDETTSTTEAEGTTDVEESPTHRRSSGGGKRVAAADTRDAKRVAADEQNSLPEAQDVSDDRDETDALDATTPQATPSTPEHAPTDTVDAVTEEPATQTPTLATVLRSLFAPQAAAHHSDEPEAPGASLLMWTMLAYARRPFGERTSEAGTATAVSSTVQTTGSAGDVQASAMSAPIPGDAYQSPVIGADGTIFQVTTNIEGDTRVSILDSNAQVLTSESIAGTSAGSVHAVARPDGTLIVVTDRFNRSIVSAVDSQGTVTRVATVTGYLDSQVTVGANGALYFSTVVPKLFSPVGETIPYRFVRISPTNTVRSFSHDTTVQLAPDGSAYLVSSGFGFSTLRAIDSNGTTRTIPLPFGADPSAPILGQDGTVYVTVGVRNLFGAKATRLYTVDGAARTVRTIPGLPGDSTVTADGLSLETFTFNGSTDDGTGTTYISRITADTINTSDVINGRIAGFQVTPDGTVYAPINDPSLDNAPVKVVDLDGNITTVTLPGKLVVGERSVRGGGSHGSDDAGYINYTSNGTEYVAVLNPDATVSRTIELPQGASGGSVFFGPDGAAYELLEYRDAEGQVVSMQILALSTDTYTANVPGDAFSYVHDDVVFGPDGIGYLLTGTETGLPGNPVDLDVLGFDAAGDTVVRASSLTNPVTSYDSVDRQVLAFGSDGTAYVTLYYSSPDEPGVYALTPSGAQKVADIGDYAPLRQAYLPTFSADGTGYVTVGGFHTGSGDGTTTVTSFSPPTVL